MKTSILPFLGILLLALIMPSSASYSLQEVSVIPPSDATPPGSPLNASAVLLIIPAGPTTFIEGYSIVLSTDLDRAAWNARVLVDGHQAAVFEKSGRTVFISGYLLSYPLSSDVEVDVTLNGTVPTERAGDPITVFRVFELNNQGEVVPGSETGVIRALELPQTLSSPPVPSESDAIPPSPTRAGPGITNVTVIAVIALAVLSAGKRAL
ncbi:MAG TPA: hypothetical protein PK477_04255 [Methanoregulaceae archaeon]|nr:hypothetical protein [Methanoregulaceae archaeon]HQJ39260.1 hypothetical protein [Methanoregulaceae archaeon]HQN88682.1 hypothetical protein [Methanoregulaceae archaeon]HQP81729.1 hypothetical protein [Methanoregulaceae archaeon]